MGWLLLPSDVVADIGKAMHCSGRIAQGPVDGGPCGATFSKKAFAVGCFQGNQRASDEEGGKGGTVAVIEIKGGGRDNSVDSVSSGPSGKKTFSQGDMV